MLAVTSEYEAKVLAVFKCLRSNGQDIIHSIEADKVGNPYSLYCRAKDIMEAVEQAEITEMLKHEEADKQTHIGEQYLDNNEAI